MNNRYTIVLAILCIFLAQDAAVEHPRFSLWWTVYTLIAGYATQPFINPVTHWVRQWWGRREKPSEDNYALISEK